MPTRIVKAQLEAKQAEAAEKAEAATRLRYQAARAFSDLDKLIRAEAGLWALLELPPREPPKVDWRLRASVTDR